MKVDRNEAEGPGNWKRPAWIWVQAYWAVRSRNVEEVMGRQDWIKVDFLGDSQGVIRIFFGDKWKYVEHTKTLCSSRKNWIGSNCSIFSPFFELINSKLYFVHERDCLFVITRAITDSSEIKYAEAGNHS